MIEYSKSVKELNNTFDLDRLNPIFLYGDNYIARRMCTNLREEGYDVRAIIDRRYVELQKESCGLELMSLELLQESEFSKDAVIIVCMASGLTHESVLPDLMEKGFENIIYLPMLINRPLLEQEIIRRAFLAVMSGTFDAVADIPKTIELSDIRTVIVYKNKKETAFLCPVSILRTATEEIIKRDVLPGREGLQKKISRNSFELPLAELESYKQLFSYLMGQDSYPSEYLSLMRETNEEQQKLLENRRSLLEVYEQNYEYNFSFFLYSPARAEWNQNGYLNISDGLHRCVYLMLKGKKFVPVVVKNEDFIQYERNVSSR